MVDRFLDQMWAHIGSILQDRRPHSTALASWSAAPLPLDVEQNIPDTILDMYDEEEHNQQEEEEEYADDPVVQMSDSEFIKDYAAFLHAHYGRAPQYLTDLYCGMAPIMVEMTSDATGVHTLHRYWWLPINHPLHIRMHAHREPNCGQVNAGFCGSCVIYADSVIVKWIGELWKLFYSELGQELQVPKHVPEQEQQPQQKQVEQNSNILVHREEEEKEEKLPPPVIRMGTTVSNKKGD